MVGSIAAYSVNASWRPLARSGWNWSGGTEARVYVAEGHAIGSMKRYLGTHIKTLIGF